jgi:hypothetical protein
MSNLHAAFFSCANIIAKGFSNDQLLYKNDKLGLDNTMCRWNTGVMVSDNGPVYACVDVPLKRQPFPATIVIYIVYTVFLINLMLF